MQPFLTRLQEGPVVVADGAMGSLLMERGLGPGESPEALNLTRPELMQEVAGLYLEAGAELIQTNTFGASPLKLALYGLDDKAEDISRLAVEAVREAVGDRAYVSGSCGPSGRILEPYGDVAPDEMRNSFRRQLAAMIEAGVDVLCIETMTDVGEATMALEAARQISPDLPVMATMTFDATPRGYYTIMGTDVRQAAEALLSSGADVVGSNCGNGIENMIEIAREFRACTDAPLLIQSNAGLPETIGGDIVYPETPEFMAERAVKLAELGVNIIGGCCGTTPEHIRALARALH